MFVVETIADENLIEICGSAFIESDMHEKHPIEKKLKIEAERISAEHGNAPVVIIVGGSKPAKITRTMTASCIKEGRLRDLLGLLQSSIQIESWKHFRNWK